MDIGAGIGVLSFYFYKLFKGCCEIDNIERNESIYNLGIKYFGLKNYFSQENRVNWFFEDVEKCLDKMIKSNEKKEEKKYENKTGFYDLICNEINDIEPKEDTVPSKKYFTDEFITNIKQLLKPYGIYTVNILSKSCKSLYENYLKLEKHFPTIFTINAENGLAAIFYCFNNKLDMEKFNEKFQNNKELMEKSINIEFAVIKSIFNEVISRVQDMGELKSKFEEKAKNS
jgi:spermidine synthase